MGSIACLFLGVQISFRRFSRYEILAKYFFFKHQFLLEIISIIQYNIFPKIGQFMDPIVKKLGYSFSERFFEFLAILEVVLR